MNFEEVIKGRYSLRQFDEKKEVEDEVLKEILDMAINAPSACNSMPYKITVATKEKAKLIASKRKLNMNKFAEKAKVIFVIEEDSYNLTAKAGNKITDIDFRSIDIGIMVQNICLAAYSKGLVTCILGMFDEKSIQEIIGTKSPIRLLVAMGYPEKDRDITKKKSVEEIFKII
ncbi:nitroreductase family protein [Peptoniphilus sp.]|uniref:nitroreductase family protein n=1 Tax=Peptoniphilus sp. TaxID=1971214 RepID=UPI0039914B95